MRDAAFDALTTGNVLSYSLERAALADIYEEQGRYARAAHSQRRAETARMPGCLWPHPRSIPNISEHQREELARALRCPVALLTGTPGTGKTFVAASVIASVVAEHGPNVVAVCAPTGKAAVRVAQALASHGLRGVACKTIHSLLEISRNGHDGQGWGFQRWRGNPLEAEYLFVDEASMLDTSLLDSLLDACAYGAHVLFVGDPHQLPPVGHGAPLRDLMSAGMPCARLREIRRNAGAIVTACAAIMDGLRFVAEGNLQVVKAADPAKQIEAVVRECKRLGGPGVTQVICALNKGSLGRREVNAVLQAALNPDGQAAPGNPYRVGDKVICLRNGWYTGGDSSSSDDVYVANGEMGTVVSVSPSRSLVRLSLPNKSVTVPVGRRSGDDDEDANSDGEGGGGGISGCFDLGYAITCHKSQGSEWSHVLVLVDGSFGARQICTREWLYTAISRASQTCLLVGDEGAAQMMVKRSALHNRRTRLKELITGQDGRGG